MDEPSEIGKWTKIAVLGEGGFGTVKLWKNRETEECTAIKKCKFQKIDSLTPKQRKRWENEVQIMKTISHRNVIKFKTIPTDLENTLLKFNPSKLPLLSMEYCTKGSLRHLLREPKNICGLQESDVMCILNDISKGLSYLHSLNITHRDIKPDNVVLQYCSESPGNSIYKIIDLGYAKEINDATVSFVGTLYYTAPEIFLTQQYNNCVDYWSLGILAFEIICGVLPFLPSLGPYERFKKIQEKGPDDICIYLSHAGSVTFSQELKRENHVSHCFKQNMEIWLRHVLNFDPIRRAQNFPNGSSIFEQLVEILNMKIVKVFSVYKLEFYSYEVNESTLLGTLKDWISRDIKVPKTDLILIFNDILYSDDQSLVVNLIVGCSTVYVFKNNSFISDSVNYNFPKLLRDIFNKSQLTLNINLVRELYAQTIFYITSEITCIEIILKSFQLYYSVLDNLCNKMKSKFVDISKHLKILVSNVDNFNNMTKNNICDISIKSIEYNDCINYLQRLFASFERSMYSYSALQTKVHRLNNQKDFLSTFYITVKNIIEECNINPQFKKTTGLVSAEASQEKNRTFIPNIKSIVSDVIKEKDKLLRNKDFKNFSRSMAKVFNGAYLLNDWMDEFKTHIQDQAKAFILGEAQYKKLMLEVTKDSCKDKIFFRLSNGNISKESIEHLVEENTTVRKKIEELLCNSINAHVKYKEEWSIFL